MSKTDITIVGVGNIGAAIVKKWLEKGITVTMWNRNPDRPWLKDLVDLGAVFEKNLNTAIAKSDVLLLSVAAYNNITEFFSSILPLEKDQSPKTVINITTGTPHQAREMNTWFKSNGIAKYLDGAIMVTPELVGTEHSSIWLSGETEEVVSEISSMLSPLGKLHYVAQDPGAASLWDIAALAAMDGMLTGGLMAMNLLKRQKASTDGKPPSVELPVRKIVVPLLSSFLPFLGDIAAALDEEDWGRNFGNPVSMQLKGFETILEGMRQEKVSTGGLELFHSLMKRTLKEKGGDAGLAAMGTYMLEE
ncbi:6-phosphogluconate dehydrogenase nad-binding [Fusarium albosuccineum]|uniref:6-phosphogluconate dehydrogenase nad-binding n=1 Tax=Fusarium albosuccineum TaxID=1237068 RepID=A0A8H4PA74_9HYPO|nr:6-phosphogluconate dehydrogenase nad-binding [Fusarium albosuccineum]